MKRVSAKVSGKLTVETTIENFWVDSDGARWCFLYIGGVPWLACEEDV